MAAETYFTGKPCKRGHISERYKASKGCVGYTPPPQTPFDTCPTCEALALTVMMDQTGAA